LFVLAVLLFIAGIYLQARYSLPFIPVSVAALVLAGLVPFFLSKTRLSNLATVLILVCFSLVGMARLGYLQQGRLQPDPDPAETVYEGVVVETSPWVKILGITKPAAWDGIRVAFPSDIPLEINQKLLILGTMRDLNPSFKNPYVGSWKQLRRLEGINYEIRGKVLLIKPGASLVGDLRNYFRKNIETSGARHTDVLKALTIGDRTSLDPEKNNLFLHTGTSHLLAISGFNVGIISGFFFFIARALLRRSRYLRLSGRDTRYAALLAIPFPFLFMLIAGAGVSVIRATIMLVIFMTALFFERGRHALNTMAFSALVILLIYPHSLFTPSFQLTFMSLLFIVLFVEKLYPSILKVRMKVLVWSLSTILSTAAATLGTVPIVLYYFYGINPFSVLHNLVAIPLIGIVATAGGLIGMALPYGRYILIPSGEIIHATLGALTFLDFGYLYPLIRPDLTEVLLYYGLILSLLYCRKRVVAASLLLIVVPLCLLQAYLVYEMRYNRDLRIHFIDVGSGDSIFIEAPGGRRILIDGGGFFQGDADIGKQVITPYLLSRKTLTLDYVINTHPHLDHLGGLLYILKNFRVGAFVTGYLFPVDGKQQQALHIIRERGIPLELWKKGDKASSEGNCVVRVLHPARDSFFDDPNNASLVLQIQYGLHKFLLPGDIGGEIEDGLVLSDPALRSDVLKVPHHGSRFSSTLPFLLAVKPQLAVLSAGAGSKELPSREALDRLAALSIPVLRTDKNGLICVRSDGARLSATAFR